MPEGIAKKSKEFLIVEFENYNNIPHEVVMPHPLHNTNAGKIEPVKYNLSKEILFYWVKPWYYTDPPYLTISFNGETVEHIENAQIERVKEALDEYNSLSKVQILNKHISYLKSEQSRLKQKGEDLKQEHEIELLKKQTEIDVLEKTIKNFSR